MPEAGLCPSCQQRFVDAAPSRVSTRSRKERTKAFGLLLILLVILSVFFRLTFPGSVDALTSWIVLMILLSLPGLALGAIFAFFVRAFIHSWTPPRTCPTCGRRVFSNPEAAAFSSCPGCRQRPVDPARAHQEQVLGWAVTLGLLAIGSTLLGMSLAEFAAADNGWNYWLAVPLVTLAIGLAMIAALVLIVYLRIRSMRRLLRDERFTSSWREKVRASRV